MNEPTAEHLDHEQQLDRIVTPYLKLREQGRRPDHAPRLARYPPRPAPLRHFFAAQGALKQRPVGLRPAESVTLSPAPAGAAPSTRDAGGLDDYEVLVEVARGGMGVVYKARQKSLNRLV